MNANRHEFNTPWRTRADVEYQKGFIRGKIRGLRRVLQKQLEMRFGTIPPAMMTTIEATEDAARLDEWLRASLDARSIEDVGISSPK